MENLIEAKDYILMFSEPDIIQYRCNNGKPYFCRGQAEEFARNFFSKGVINNDKEDEKMTHAKQWMIGILYHKRKNSIPEIKDITGYKSTSTIAGAVKKSGRARSFKKATDMALLKRYGKTMSQFSRDRMRKLWKNDNGSYRDKISRATSDALKKYWKNKKAPV
jgi:hypothetical protein